ASFSSTRWSEITKRHTISLVGNSIAVEVRAMLPSSARSSRTNATALVPRAASAKRRRHYRDAACDACGLRIERRHDLLTREGIAEMVGRGLQPREMPLEQMEPPGPFEAQRLDQLERRIRLGQELRLQ